MTRRRGRSLGQGGLDPLYAWGLVGGLASYGLVPGVVCSDFIVGTGIARRLGHGVAIQGGTQGFKCQLGFGSISALTVTLHSHTTNHAGISSRDLMNFPSQ